jgi:hypothetical protein
MKTRKLASCLPVRRVANREIEISKPTASRQVLAWVHSTTTWATFARTTGQVHGSDRCDACTSQHAVAALRTYAGTVALAADLAGGHFSQSPSIPVVQPVNLTVDYALTTVRYIGPVLS